MNPATVLALHLGCSSGSKPAVETSTTTTYPSDGGSDGGADGGSDDGGADGGGEAPEFLRPVPTYSCPPPPEGARVFSGGTIIADQIFTYDDYDKATYSEEHEWQGWAIIATGLSYTHEQACYDIAYMNRYDRDVKEGRANGEFWFELAVYVPGTTAEHWIGVHPQSSGNLRHRTDPNHIVTIGWRDEGDLYPRFVSALPQGWTRSEVCVGTVSPDYVYLTVLWDPADGPYRTNDWTRTDQPIWFDLEIWRTGGGDPANIRASKHRSCMSTSWWRDPESFDLTSADDFFKGYTWPGKHD